MLDSPSVVVKWRQGEPPYVEVYQCDELILAGWVFESPDMVLKNLLTKPNFDASAIYDGIPCIDDGVTEAQFLGNDPRDYAGPMHD